MTAATEGAIRELLRDPESTGSLAIRGRLAGAGPASPGEGRLGDLLARRLTPDAPAPTSRRLPPVVEGRVRLERADGAVVEIDAASVDAALAQRDSTGAPVFQLDTPELEARRERRSTYGGRGLETAATSALSGATIGLSDVAIGGLGGGDYLSGLREMNPEAAALGELGGAVAPVLLAGPLGLEATAGRGVVRGAVGALGLPTRALAGLSEAAGGAVARGVAGAEAGLGRRLLGRALGTGVEGAIEGGVGEAGRILSERAIGDGNPDLTAETVLARIGSGALLGGAAGGIMGSAGGLLAEGGRAGARLARSSTDVIRRAWGDSVGTELSDVVARAWGSVSGRDPEAIRRWLSSSEDGRELRGLIGEGDRIYEDGTAELGEALNVAERARARLVGRWREGLRTDELERLVDPRLLERQATSARALAADIRDRVEALATDFHGAPVGGHARGLAREIDRRIGDLELAIARTAGDVTVTEATARRASAELNAALNGIKRDVDALIARSDGMGPVAAGLREANDGIRRSLEDGAVWGDAAGAAQREINEAFSRELTTRNAFRRRLLSAGDSLEGRSEVNPFEAELRADSARVAGFLRQAGTAANATAETTFRETVESTARLLETMERHLNLTPAERAMVAEARRASGNALDTLGRVRGRAEAMNQWQALTGGGTDALGRAVVGAVAGASFGGPLGAILAGAATNPSGVVRSLATLERWSRGATDEIAAGVRDFIRGGLDRGARVTRTAARNARSAAVLGGVRAYEARVRRLDEERADVAGTVERISGRVSGMDAAPRTRDALIAATTRGHSYLASVRPRARALPGQIVPTLDRPPSPDEIDRFLRAARVVDEPLSVLRDLNSGRLTRDGVDALRNVYPQLYQRIVAEVMQQIGERGRELAYERRIALGMLLGVPTDPSLTPEHMAALQGVLSAPSALPQPTPPARAPRLSSATPSGTEALERSDAA